MLCVCPDDIAYFFSAYMACLERQFPIHGCYLYGSVALGAYDPVKSDLDFMLVLASPLDDSSLLEPLHADLCRQFPLARKLEGHFVPLSAIQRCALTESFPHVADGAYHGLQGVMTVYWHQLHTCGVRITGPAPETLFPPIPWEQVQQEMAYNINGYGYNRTLQPDETFYPDSAIDFTVLTVCRILYTLEHRQIIAKVDAGRWALSTLPEIWHPLIREAMLIRTGNNQPSLFPSLTSRAQQTRQFILAMRELCNQRYFTV